MQTPAKRIAFRPDIQGLRAVAVALVVLAHAGAPGFAGGFVGVDVFFVLSGYLITGLLVEERLATGRIRYLQFLARRLRRLLPAMLTMLLAVLLVASVILTAFEMRMQAQSFPFAAVWVSNFFFAFAERDYFQALQDYDLFLHTWSLGVEEQFYLMWPWLVLVLAGFRMADQRRQTFGRSMAIAMGMIGALSFVVCLMMTQYTAILAFYMMPARIWQFALGGIVFAGLHLARSSDRGAGAALPAGLTGLGLVLGSAVLLGDNIRYPGWYALAPSLGATLLIAAGTLSQRNALAAGLALRPLVWVGDRSYSIYLWHWPVLILGSALGITHSVAGVVVAVAVSVVMAALTYRYVEYPFWKGQYRTIAAPRVIAAAVFVIVASIAAFGALKAQVFGEGTTSASVQGFDPRMDMDKRIYSASKNCDTFHHDAELLPCDIGNEDGERLAVLVGDSIGAQWSPLVSGLLPGSEWRIVVLTKSACAIIDKTWYYEKAGGDYVVCTEWRNRVLDYIATARPDVIFIGSSPFYDFDEQDWTAGTSRILARVAPAAGQVVLLTGTPRLSFNGPSCLEDPWRFSFRLIDGERECEEARKDERPDHVSTWLRAATGGYRNVQLLDLNDLVCPDRRCAAATPEGVVVFRDDDHLTASFTEFLVPAVRARLETLGLSLTSPEPGTR